MSEFKIIEQYFKRIPSPNTILGIGDDAAVLEVSSGQQLVVTTDTLLADVHFFNNVSAENLGWKVLAVNLSDLAAMGAKPRWATLAMTLPALPVQGDVNWLADFSRGFFSCADTFGVELVGGDTTRGPLAFTVQALGEVTRGKAIMRSGAQIGDSIWVGGRLGLPAMALANIKQEIELSQECRTHCQQTLDRPQPQVALGLALRDIAHSMIDISDGLLADLSHMLRASDVGACLEWVSIPHLAIGSRQQNQQYALCGGDDYVLCFTTAHDDDVILAIGKQLNLSLYKIGKITKDKTLQVLDENQQAIAIQAQGYDHFA